MLQALPPPASPTEIIVTAPALPEPASARAYSVDIIDRGALADAPSTGLDQILKNVPGLQLFRRSDARSAHPTSQGVTLRALGGNASSRALLVLDGIPQSDPFGGWVNWPAYDPASLAQVQVVRGGGSVVHGAGALAGTIEMTSQLGGGIGGQVETGSRESNSGRLHLGAPMGGGGAFLLTGRIDSGDGFIPITAATRGPADMLANYRATSARAHLAMPLSPDIQMQATVSGFRDRRERGVRFTRNHTDGTDASLRLVAAGAWDWSALGYVQWRDFESSFASVAAGRAAATRVSLQDSVPSRGVGGSVEVRPPLGRAELRLGFDARHTQGETRELYSYVAGEPTRRRIAGGETFSGGLFGEVAGRIGALTLSAGARMDHWRISNGRLLERQIAGAVTRAERYEGRSGWLPTARAGAVFTTEHGISFRSAAYLGWRLPTLNELFRPFRAGSDATAANSQLQPERLAGAEVGAGYSRDGLSLDLTLFANRLTEAISNVTLGSGPGTFPGVGFVGAGGDYRQRRNVDAIKVRGVELTGAARRGPWSGRLAYSFADARVHAEGAASALDGLRPAQTPRHTWSAGFEWQRGQRTAAFELRHVGVQFEGDLNRVRLPPATTANAFAALPLKGKIQLFLRGENLLNELVVAGIGSDGAVERATPRTLWIGLRLTSDGVTSSSGS